MAARVLLVMAILGSLVSPMGAASGSSTAPALVGGALPASDAPALFPQEESMRIGRPMDLLSQYQLRMLSNAALRQSTEQDFFLYRLAMMEQAGIIPEGTTMWAEGAPGLAEAAQRDKEPVPELIFRDPYRVCDVDDDGVDDLVFNEIDPIQRRLQVRMVSGADGSILWVYYGNWYYTAQTEIAGVYGRHVLATPDPKQFESFSPTIDINDDGVCDLMFVDMKREFYGIDPVIMQIDATVRILNGSQAYSSLSTFWTRPFSSRTVFTFDLFGCFLNIAGENIPSGFLHADSKNGARWVWKETDIYLTLVQDCILGSGLFVYDWRNTDTVHYVSSRNGRDIWARDLNFTREENPLANDQEDVTNWTYLTGATQLAGNDELEIIVDQRQATTPQTPGLANPITGEPLFVYGSAITMLALRGEDGKNLWNTEIHNTGSVRVNPALEEPFELLVWTYGQILCDMTEDGIPEVVSTSLWVETSSQIPTTTNGRFTTHIHPLNGATGLKLWPKADQRVQGWGYAACMSAKPNELSVPLFAFGSLDLPTAIAPAGRFPPKDVRVSVFDARVNEGAVLWDYRDQFPQDSYISYHMTLHQYRNALAPADYNGDGVKDLLTPAQYIQAIGANQTLLSQAVHQYEIYEGREGGYLKGFRAWGPMGQAMICRPDDPGLTVVSGHGRRIDISRFNVTPVPEQWWRYPIYNNPSIQSATLGTDISMWFAKCLEHPLDGSTVFTINMGLVSAKRGREVRSVYGLVQPDEKEKDVTELGWINPPVAGKPPIDTQTILNIFEVKETSPALTLAFTAGPAVPGLVAGIGLARLRVRKGGVA